MKTIVHLNIKERKAIQCVLRHRDGRKVLHAMILLLLSTFKPKKVARLLNCSLSNLYKRARRYECDGIGSFGDHIRSGRPSKWEPKHDACLKKLLEKSPREQGYATNLWTCELLAKALLKLTGWRFSSEIIRRRMHLLDYRWKRPKQAPANCLDPFKEDKLALIEAAKSLVEQNADHHLLYVDGADFNLLNVVRASWSLKGKQAEYPTPGDNKKIFALGSYEPMLGRFLFKVSYRKRSSEFLAFLKQLLKQYTGKLHIVLDNVRTQKTQGVQQFVAENKERLELLYIPLYSPQYNQPIERVWGTCRAWVNGNESCFDVSELRRKTIAGLRRQQTLLRMVKAS